MRTSAATILGAILGCAFLLLAASSVWLRGRLWFVSVVATLASALVLSEVGSSATESSIVVWLTRCGLALLFGAFFYFLASRHLTRTSVFDTTYQSHAALVAFLDEQGDSSALAALTRRLGPLLLLAFIAYGALAAWAQFTGRVG